MDMNNVAEIVVSHIDTQPINQAIKERAEALASQLNPEAAKQFISDMSELVCNARQNGNSASFSVEPSTAYLINYLRSHDTPVLGGDDGTAHNVDGTTYESIVPERLWGTPLPDLELPTIDGEDEAYHIAEIMAQDAMQDAVNRSKQEITEQIAKPYIIEQLSSIGG